MEYDQRNGLDTDEPILSAKTVMKALVIIIKTISTLEWTISATNIIKQDQVWQKNIVVFHSPLSNDWGKVPTQPRFSVPMTLCS